MRLLPGVGCEYGTDWIVREILENDLEAANIEEMFEESLREWLPEETKIGWMTFDTIKLMKENDPVGWRCGVVDYESLLQSDEIIFSFDHGSSYYRMQDVLDLIERADE
jgi:hypothetical protein